MEWKRANNDTTDWAHWREMVVIVVVADKNLIRNGPRHITFVIERKKKGNGMLLEELVYV